MPTPRWTLDYDYSDTPEKNLWGREEYGSPVITENRVGILTDRNVTINATNGDAIFASTYIPDLSSGPGMTVEFVVAVSGPADGNAGIEVDFDDCSFLVTVHANKVHLTLPADVGGQQDFDFTTASNGNDTTFRVTMDSGRRIRIYRNGAEATDPQAPITVPTHLNPKPRMLWWTEAGATAIWKGLRHFRGGAATP